jgi:hypothetical protein
MAATGLTVRPEHFEELPQTADRPRRRLYVAGLGVLLTGAGVGAYVGAVQGLNAVMPPPHTEAAAKADTDGGSGDAVVTVPHGPDRVAAVEVVSTVDPEVRIKWRTKYITVTPVQPRPAPARTPGPAAPLPTPKPNCDCTDPPNPEPTDGTPPATPTGQPEGSPTAGPATPEPTPEVTATGSQQG